MKKRACIVMGLSLIGSLLFTGCSSTGTPATNTDVASARQNVVTKEVAVGDTTVTIVDTDNMNMAFDEEDLVSTPEDKKVANVDLNTAGTTKVELKPDQSLTCASSGSASSAASVVSQIPSAVPAEILDINAGGTYTLSGSKIDSMVTVDAGEENVQLILQGVTVKNSKGPAIYVRSAGKVEITLAEGTVNHLSDGTSYTLADGTTVLNAALVCKSDLAINGNGKLIVNGNYKHGIVSKDDLVISSATLEITAAAAGMEGKDCVKLSGGSYQITAGSDGIRSDNIEDVTKGFVYISGSKVNINAGNDGIQAETVLKADNANLTIVTGNGGSSDTVEDDGSHKGLKAGLDIIINGGVFSIDAKDDAIHSNGTVTLSGGTYTLSSGDDGIHADTDLAISGDATKLMVVKSLEGLEGSSVVISGGTVLVTADKDGINAAASSDTFTSASGVIAIAGGTVTVKAGGDGLDAKESLSVTGGTVMVSCPDSETAASIDYASSGTVENATLVATGSAAKAKTVSSTGGVLLIQPGSQSAGTAVTVTDKAGNQILTCKPSQGFSSLLIASPKLKKGESYVITIGTFSQTMTAE